MFYKLNNYVINMHKWIRYSCNRLLLARIVELKNWRRCRPMPVNSFM